MQSRKRLLYIYNTRPKFVEIDENILHRYYDVQSMYIKQRSIYLFSDIWNALRHTDIVLAWFASWHSAPAFTLAALKDVPRILITGGYDVACDTEIGYGLRQGGLPYVISDIVFRLTDLALPFSQASYMETLANTPLSSERVQRVDLGVPDHTMFTKPVPKEQLILTVASLDSVSVERKGIRLLVEAARLLPDIPFKIVGKVGDNAARQLVQHSPMNVEFTGFLSENALTDLRRRAKIYVQASFHEGFGLALAESMLARCIPVVSRRGSLPDVVGDTGFYTDLNTESLVKTLKEALQHNSSLGHKSRDRILNRFSVERRARKLHHILENCIENK